MLMSDEQVEELSKPIVLPGHIDDDDVLRVPLEAWQIDLLCAYGSSETGLKYSDDDVQLDQRRRAQQTS